MIRRSAAGWTLAELLTALLILALLAGLLFPAVSGARRSAARIPCIAQLRQLGMAALMYEDLYGVVPVWPAALGQTRLLPDSLWVCPEDLSGDLLGHSGHRAKMAAFLQTVLPETATDNLPRSYFWARQWFWSEALWSEFHHAFGSSSGIAACVLHGDYAPSGCCDDQGISHLDYTGVVLRLHYDGSVVVRRRQWVECDGLLHLMTLPLFADPPYRGDQWERWITCAN